jgi:hypothetical protein
MTKTPKPPENATEVVQHLASLALELNNKVAAIRTAERDFVEKRGAADLAYSREYLAAEGSIDARRHQATIKTFRQRMDADVAEAVVRHLRREIDALRVRIDVGRSYGAAIRAELSALVGGDQ